MRGKKFLVLKKTSTNLYVLLILFLLWQAQMFSDCTNTTAKMWKPTKLQYNINSHTEICTDYYH